MKGGGGGGGGGGRGGGEGNSVLLLIYIQYKVCKYVVFKHTVVVTRSDCKAAQYKAQKRAQLHLLSTEYVATVPAVVLALSKGEVYPAPGAVVHCTVNDPMLHYSYKMHTQ